MDTVNLVLTFIFHIIVAGCIAVPLGYFHEYLHMRKAKQLGYVVVNRVGNQLTINVTDKEHTKQIGHAPYKVIIPISIIILIIGIYIFQIGLIIGAVGTILIHCISFPLEGRDEKKDGCKPESN